jgi:predicted nucleic-acid-binding Zn-ribbon protein
VEKFKSVENCKKCGSNIYTPAYKLFTGKRKYVSAFIDTNGDVIPEHLEVTCRECGFTWQETCADV